MLMRTYMACFLLEEAAGRLAMHQQSKGRATCLREGWW